MKPEEFKEQHIVLQKPQSMTDEECGTLGVHRTEDGQCISKWKASFRDRVKFLFHGTIWLGVVSGKTQPPVWLDCTKTIFNKDTT